MNTSRLWNLRFAVLALVACPAAFAHGQSPPIAAVRGAGDELSPIELKLLGAWQGGACIGNYTFNSDRSFVLDAFTPGGNTITGSWHTRWDSLPPTLALKCETSDFRTKAPNRPEYRYLGKTLELKLLELNDDILVYRAPDPNGEQRFERVKK